MISGANEEELELAGARMDIMLATNYTTENPGPLAIIDKYHDKEIERLSKEVDMWNKKYNEQIDIINELEKSAKEIVRVGKNKGYQYVENLNELKTKEEIYDFIEFYYGLYLLEQLDKLKELKEGK